MSQTPEALGKAIGKVYQSAMRELAKLLRAESLDNEAVVALHNSSIAAFVALGAEREKLEDAERAEVDDVATEMVFELDPEDYQTYIDNYRDVEDQGIARLVLGFNIMTQYAFYELLRAQLPHEAKRLGIT